MADRAAKYQSGEGDWWRWIVLLDGERIAPIWSADAARGVVEVPVPIKHGCVYQPGNPARRTLHGRVEIVLRADWDRVAAVYSDGGLIGRNPSLVGGTWAWCHVNAAGYRVRSDAGIITPERVGLREVSNNTSELCALARALRALPDGWTGTAYTDSGVTLHRLWRNGTDLGLPAGWLAAARKNLARLGEITPVLLGGHPNREELAAGVRKDGLPVSEHNVWCDRECTRLAREWQAAHAEPERVAA